MQEFLDLFHKLAKTKSYKVAKRWAIGAGVITAGQAYFAIINQWELVFAACIPLCVVLASMMESLSEANQVLYLQQYLEETGQTISYHPVTGRVVLVERNPASSISPDNYLTHPVADLYQPEEDVEKLDEDENLLELSDDEKLLLCQYYSFLYCVIQLKKTGEERLRQMLGMPARQYRGWINGLAQSGLELVSLTTNKAVVRETNFEEALRRIAAFQGIPNLWDYPRQVYSDTSNWVEYEPAQERTLEVKPYREEVQQLEVGSPATLLPRYPVSLEVLNTRF